MQLEDIKKEFDKYAVFADKHILEVIANNILVNNYLTGIDPQFLTLITQSSGGKSMILNTLTKLEKTLMLDDLSANAFLSGYGGGKKGVNDGPSILDYFKNGTMIIPDLTLILSKGKEHSGPILGDLRMIYDGQLIKMKGTGKKGWNGRIGCIFGCTPEAYRYFEEHRGNGERTLYWWMNQPSDEEVNKKLQERGAVSAKDISEIIGPLWVLYFDGLVSFIRKHGQAKLILTEEQQTKLDYAVSFLVRGKTTVHTDFKTGLPDRLPQQAGVGRDNRMIYGALVGYLQMQNYKNNTPENTQLEGDDWYEKAIIYAWSAINPERRKVLSILSHPQRFTASEIGNKKGLGMEKDMVMKILTPLNSIGLIRKDVSNLKAFKWYISDEPARSFIKVVDAIVTDNSPTSQDFYPEEEENIGSGERVYMDVKQEEVMDDFTREMKEAEAKWNAEQEKKKQAEKDERDRKKIEEANKLDGIF